MPRRSTTSPGARGQPVLGRWSAVVVEPDSTASELTVGMLEILGYEASAADSGSAALQAIADHSPELLLLSLDLSDMDAAEVLRIVRRVPVGAGLSVIAMSGGFTAGREEQNAVRRQGVRHFLSRPFTVRRLRDTLSRAHPGGPVDGHDLLGTSSSSQEWPMDVDLSLGGPKPEAKPEPEPEPEPPSPEPPTLLGEEPGWTLSLRAEGAEVPTVLEQVVGDEMHVRTAGARLARGTVVEIRIEVVGTRAQTLRYQGKVVKTSWRLKGGRARVAVQASVPSDAMTIARDLLLDGA